MKNTFKKVISAVLSFVVLCTIIFCVPVTAAENVPGTDIPLIYIEGQGSGLSVIENGVERQVYPNSLPEGYVQNVVKENIGVFAKAVFTQEWEEFGGVVHGVLSDMYGEVALDEHGQAPNGSTNRWTATYSKDKIKPNKVNGKYSTTQFTFHYDWRMDPLLVADQIHTYIEDVMELTGAESVALLGRCLGACMATAYMQKYDGEHVSSLILYASALNGATQASKLFAGEAYLDADGVERFVYDLQLSADETINDLIQAFVTLFNKTYGLDIACWAVNNVMPDIYLDIFPQVLIDTMATWPGYWSMVSDEDYEKAKETVFYGADTEKYADFIKIIDDYHYNVQVKAPENFKKYEERGIKVSNITKFGFQTYPVTDNADMLSDDICSVECASMGATTATLNTTLSEEYLQKAKEENRLGFISPDNKIDASTCLFPETTWFIGNLEHKNFPKIVNALIDEIVNNKDFTVNSSEKYPQYMVYADNALSPMTQENKGITERYDNSFFDALKKLLSSLFVLLKNFIQSKIATA